MKKKNITNSNLQQQNHNLQTCQPASNTDLNGCYGRLTYQDGTTYEGSVINSVPEGFGVWRFPNGDYYEGKNFKGKFHGQGIFKNFANGDEIDGHWIEGKLIGKYKLKKTNGDTFEAFIENGKIEGAAIYTKSNGNKWYQEYKNGVKINESISTSNSQNTITQSQLNSSSFDSEYLQAKKRLQGIDSMNCETYAKNQTANQKTVPPPGNAGFGSFLSILGQAALIDMNTQSWYDSCMKRLGW